jgi:hypothetical protein
MRKASSWMGMIEIRTQGIGSVAAQALTADQDLRHVGTSSRGLFVQTTGRWIVFVSFELVLSPLTMTLGEGSEVLKAVRPGSIVRYTAGKAEFAEWGIRVMVDLRTPWEPPAPVHAAGPHSEQLGRLTALTTGLPAARLTSEISALLPYILEPASLDQDGSGKSERAQSVQRLRHGLQVGNAESVARELTGFLGLGSGLTPSGDDLITGLLLALNRWELQGWGAARRSKLNEAVTRAAYACTSTFSANLIECAAAGGADERLLHAIDHLWTGYPSRAEALARLLDWGASSGADALVGMAIVLTTPAGGDAIAGT